MTSFNAPLTFDLNETFRRIVEKCVLATANRLVNIEDSTKKIKHFITLSDIFKYYLNDNSFVSKDEKDE